MASRDAENAYQPAIGHSTTTLLTIAAGRSELVEIVDWLRSVEGVVRVSIDLPTGTVRVLFDSAVTSERAIVEAVQASRSTGGT